MYSQNNEEEIIASFFAGTQAVNRRFLDIGAYNPFKFSNTRKLYENGWGGVFIEPSPSCFSNFIKEYGTCDRVILINALLGESDCEADFWDSNGDAVSSTSQQHAEKWQRSGAKFEKVRVNCVSPGTLFGFVGKHFDFINIDTESTNVEVFALIPDDVFMNALLVCIEHDNRDQVFLSRLEPMGYRIIARNGENLILGKK